MCKHTKFSTLKVIDPNISLSEHFDGFIATQIANGRYDTASEVILAALRLLEEHKMERNPSLETLRAALIEGESSGDSSLLIGEITAAEKHKRQTKRAWA